MTFAQFSKKVGLPPSTIFRIERCEQSITLGRLDAVMKKLKCTLADVFGEASELNKTKIPAFVVCLTNRWIAGSFTFKIHEVVSRHPEQMKTALLATVWLATVLLYPVRAQVPVAASVDPGFVKGADLSLLSFIEEHGVQYREAGQPKSPLLIFQDHGCNYVRLRLFVRPDGTKGQVNSLSYTLSLAKRVKLAGFHLLLDLHYSDGWADPGHQAIPTEWKGLSHSQLIERVFIYTRETLSAFEKEQCLPDMVQVGNEITNGMMWPEGGPLKDSSHFDALADLLKAGIRGVRACGDADKIKVMLHVDKGADEAVCKWFFDNCQKRGVPFDVIGLSFYPFLHASLDHLGTNLTFLSETYHKDIIVVETSFNAGGIPPPSPSFPYTPEGQKAYLEALTRLIAATPEGHGKGFFYWAPEWIMAERWYGATASGPWETRALFDNRGNMLPAMETYQMNPTRVK